MSYSPIKRFSCSYSNLPIYLAEVNSIKTELGFWAPQPKMWGIAERKI